MGEAMNATDRKYYIQSKFRKNILAVQKRLQWMLGNEDAGKVSKQPPGLSKPYGGRVAITNKGNYSDYRYHGKGYPD
jgi:hypothetical protein